MRSRFPELRGTDKKEVPSFDKWLVEVSPTFTWHWPHLEHIREHLETITQQLEVATPGKTKKLMIFIPPRHGKSEQVTVRYPAYVLEKWPHKRVIIGAYNQTLSNKFSRKTRKIANTRLSLSKERTAVEDWETTDGGGLRAVGVGGGITGQGGDLILIDDPVKNREEANSQTYREKVWDWYRDDLYTRLEPGGAIILIMTRWHQDDLAGRILASDDGPNWTVINLPALAEKDDPLGRQEGEALCPERYDEKALADIKRVLGSSFDALFQQRPAAAEGEIFKREWWKYYKEPPKFKFLIQSWDTAFEEGEENDPSGCTTWGVTDSGIYLVDRWNDRVEFPVLKRTVVSVHNKWHPRVVLVEKKSSGHSLIQEMKANTTLPIKAIKVDTDKVSRAYAVTPIIEAGNVYLPEDAPWLQDYIDQLSVFPNGVHDEDVDTTTQALNYLRSNAGGGKAFEEFAEAMKAAEKKGHIWQNISGTNHFNCEACGISVAPAPNQTAQEAAEKAGFRECKNN